MRGHEAEPIAVKLVFALLLDSESVDGSEPLL